MPFSVMIIGGFPYSSLMKFRILRNPNGDTLSQEEPESSHVRSAMVPAPLRRSNRLNVFISDKSCLTWCTTTQAHLCQLIMVKSACAVGWAMRCEMKNPNLFLLSLSMQDCCFGYLLTCRHHSAEGFHSPQERPAQWCNGWNQSNHRSPWSF